MMEFKSFDKRVHLAEQRQLFIDCFPENEGGSSSTEAHYQWKFHSLSQNPASYEYATWYQNRLVAYYAALPFKYKVNNEVMTCAMVCDVMTSTTMRGKGVFTKLGHYATDALNDGGLDFCSGYPIRPEVLPGHLKVGWKVAFELPMYIKLLRSNGLLKTKKMGFFSPVINFLLQVYHVSLNIFTRSESSLQLKTFSKSEFNQIQGYEAFFNAWQHSIPHVLIKDAAFMDWRLNAPGADYQIVTLYEQEALLALVVVRKTVMENISCLAILDVMIKPGYDNETKLLGRLHKELVKLALNVGAEALVLMLSKYWAKRYRLIKHGFLKSPYIFKLIIKQLSSRSQDENFLAEKNWHLMWIDSDDL